MSTSLRKTAVAAFGTALLAVGVIAGPAPAQPRAAISCEESSSGEPASFYDGDSASYRYDGLFAAGPEIPKAELDRGTPQGAATWSNWDGGKDLLLVAAYGKTGEDAHIVGIDPASGQAVGTVAIAESHVGGIAVAKGWAFVQGRNSTDWETIRKYRLSSLKSALKAAGTPYLKQTGTARNVYGADFMSTDGEYLYSGQFDPAGRDKMYAYRVNDDGTLTTQPTPWEVPTKTQGLMVTDTHFIYSTSYGRDKRSNVYVVKRPGRALDSASLHCFRAPSMTEGITAYGGDAYLVFESASHVYRGDPDTRNVIPDLHKASIASLTALAG